MYLHRLDLRAIGPYAGSVSIDIAAVGASGVFLLEGPTGAGKSTIIDAVVFALYGSLAGQDASRDRLHSQHADPGTEPMVELVFETTAGVFRVRRTPAYERPKQRGTGTVTQQASAQLWRLADPTDAVGEPLSSRAQEIGPEIVRIVGLDRTQFVQTVVLPQGEFARFLRAPGEDRRALLQSLFGTEIYERTTEQLVERRRAAAASVERADAAVRDAISRFEQASGESDVSEDAIEPITLALRAAADDAAVRRDEFEALTEARRASLAAAERRSAALGRRRDLLVRRERLQAGAADVAAARGRLEVADRAARIVGLLSGLDTAVGRAARRHEERGSVLARHARAIGALGLRVGVGVGVDVGAGDDGIADQVARPELRADEITVRATTLRETAAAVRYLVAVEQDLPARRDDVVRHESAVAALGARAATTAELLAARPAERDVLVEAARRASRLASAAGPAEQELADARALGSRIVERDRAAERFDVSATALRRASEAAARAIDTEVDLRRRRAAGLAGELGAALAAGDACPVCGSLEHPHVASPQDEHPSAETIESAAEVRVAADAAQSLAAAEHAVARNDAERLDELVGDVTPERVLERIEHAEARIRDAADAAAAVTAAEATIDRHDAATRELEADRTDLAAQLASASWALESARATVRTDADRVDAARIALRDAVGADRFAALLPTDVVPAAGDQPMLADAVAATLREAAALTEVVTAVEAATAAEDDVAERRSEVAAALVEHGFADADAARSGALDAAEATPLRALVAGAERESAVIESGLAEPEVIAAADDSESTIGLGSARTDLAEAAAALDVATGTAATAEHRAASTETCRHEVLRAVAARESVSAESRAIVRLADIATAAPGVNPTGITLGTYVLMRRFEDVVAAANDRLRAMLAGRFTLETSDERETSSRARRTGLALAVRDHATDRTRDPKSLSGGETFTFSLCLALGLADVVQAESGGVSLGTLFVDEGFGTLDPETLDDVIGQLTRLTAGGRQVGIVSHVEELKQRIPDRIEVRRVPGGGSVVTTTV